MGRPAKIWIREQTGEFYTTIGKQKIPLGHDRKEAERKFHQLKGTAPERLSSLTFRKLADTYIGQASNAKTRDLRKFFLQSFCDRVKQRRASDLRVFMATEWLTNHPTWNPSTQATACRVLKSCLNWGVEQTYIPANPLAKLKAGRYLCRERILTAEERETFLKAASPHFREFLWALGQTGARPFSELAKLTASMIDWESGTAELKEHKTAHHGKSRHIYFTDELLAFLKRKAEKYPTGSLIRTRRGAVWTCKLVSRQFRLVEAKLGQTEKFSAYLWRHTYATECLEKGMSGEIVAELIGNTPAVLHRYYSKLSQKKKAMLEAAKNAVS